MNRKVLRNKSYLMSHSFNRTKMFHSKQGWLVSSALVLAMLGLGISSSHVQVHADPTTPNTPQSTNTQQSKSTTPTTTSSSPTNLASKARHVHQMLINQANPNNISNSTNPSSVYNGRKPNKIQPKNPSDPHNDNSSNSSNHVQSVTSESSISNSSSSSSSVGSSSNDKLGSNSGSGSSGSSSTKPKFNSAYQRYMAQMGSTDAQVAKLNDNQTQSGNKAKNNKKTLLGAQDTGQTNMSDGHWIYKDGKYYAPTPKAFTVTDSDDGLTYKEDPNLEAIEFTGGVASSDMWGFVSSNNDIKNATSIKFGSDINTLNVTNMGEMFGVDSSLKSLDLGNNFNTSGVTNMSDMFSDDSDLTSLKLGDKFNTSQVKDMSHMFYGDSLLPSLNLGNKFNTGNVTNMWGMFKGNEFQSLNLGNQFDTSKVTNMSQMFMSDKNLKSLNLGNNFNTSGVSDMSDMSEMFSDTPLNLLTIQSPNTKLNNNTNLPTMYEQLSQKDSSDKPYTSFTQNDFSKGNVGTFTVNKNARPAIDIYSNIDGKTAPTNSDEIDTNSSDGWAYVTANGKPSSTPVTNQNGNTLVAPERDGLIYKFNKKNNSFEFTGGTAQNHLTWFIASNNNVKSIKFDSDIDTSNVTNMKDMFMGDSSLQSIDLGKNFNTSNVTDTDSMFESDYGLQSLNLGNHFDTSKVSDMGQMFLYDTSLRSLDLGNNFDTSNVGDMDEMFESDKNLQLLNLGNKFDTSKISDTGQMFYDDVNLQSLNLGNHFDTSKVNYMGDMFGDDANLQLLTIDSPKTILSSSDNLPTMYKKLSKTSVSHTPNDFSKGNVGTFIKSPFSLPVDYFNNGSMNTKTFTDNSPSDALMFDKPNWSDTDTSKIKDLTDLQNSIKSNIPSGHSATITSFGHNQYGPFVDVNIQKSATYSDIYSNIDGLTNPTQFDSKNWAYVDQNGKISPTPVKNPDGHIMVAPVYHGLTYKYDKNGKSLEFTGGKIDEKSTGYFLSVPQFGGNGYYNTYLTSVTFDSDVDTSGVSDMSDMFYNDSGLKSLKLGRNFDTSNVGSNNHIGSMFGMFGGDNNLQSLNLGDKFDTSNVTNMDSMFREDDYLHLLNLGDKFNTSKVNDMDFMFTDESPIPRNLTLKIDTSDTTLNGSTGLSPMYKEVGVNDLSGKPYTLADSNDFTKGNIGTFTVNKNVEPTSDTATLNYEYNGSPVKQITTPKQKWNTKVNNLNQFVPSGYRVKSDQNVLANGGTYNIPVQKWDSDTIAFYTKHGKDNVLVATKSISGIDGSPDNILGLVPNNYKLANGYSSDVTLSSNTVQPINIDLKNGQTLNNPYIAEEVEPTYISDKNGSDYGTLTLKYVESNGRIDSSDTKEIPIKGKVGSTVTLADPLDYAEPNYTVPTSDFTYTIQPSDNKPTKQFTYTAPTAGNVTIQYYDVENHNQVTQRTLTANDMEKAPYNLDWIVGKQITLGMQSSQGSTNQNTLNVLQKPSGYNFVNGYPITSITLPEPKSSNQTGGNGNHVGKVRLGVMLMARPNRPTKPITPSSTSNSSSSSSVSSASTPTSSSASVITSSSSSNSFNSASTLNSLVQSNSSVSSVSPSLVITPNNSKTSSVTNNSVAPSSSETNDESKLKSEYSDSTTQPSSASSKNRTDASIDTDGNQPVLSHDQIEQINRDYDKLGGIKLGRSAKISNDDIFKHSKSTLKLPQTNEAPNYSGLIAVMMLLLSVGLGCRSLRDCSSR